jgi:hypothetical protein
VSRGMEEEDDTVRNTFLQGSSVNQQ